LIGRAFHPTTFFRCVQQKYCHMLQATLDWRANNSAVTHPICTLLAWRAACFPGFYCVLILSGTRVSLESDVSSKPAGSAFRSFVRVVSWTTLDNDRSRRSLPNSQGRRASDSSLTLPFPSIVPRVSEDTRNSLLSLLNSGLSTREAGAQLGVGHTMVSRVRVRARPCVQESRGGKQAKLRADG